MTVKNHAVADRSRDMTLPCIAAVSLSYERAASVCCWLSIVNSVLLGPVSRVGSIFPAAFFRSGKRLRLLGGNVSISVCLCPGRADRPPPCWTVYSRNTCGTSALSRLTPPVGGMLCHHDSWWWAKTLPVGPLRPPPTGLKMDARPTRYPPPRWSA